MPYFLMCMLYFGVRFQITSINSASIWLLIYSCLVSRVHGPWGAVCGGRGWSVVARTCVGMLVLPSYVLAVSTIGRMMNKAICTRERQINDDDYSFLHRLILTTTGHNHNVKGPLTLNFTQHATNG